MKERVREGSRNELGLHIRWRSSQVQAKGGAGSCLQMPAGVRSREW